MPTPGPCCREYGSTGKHGEFCAVVHVEGAAPAAPSPGTGTRARWAMSPGAVGHVDQLAADANRRLDETIAALRSRWLTTERQTAIGLQAIEMRTRWSVDQVLDIGLIAVARLADLADRTEPPVEADRGPAPCSFPRCGKPTAWLPVHTDTHIGIGMQWRHVDLDDETGTHVGHPFPRDGA